MTFSFDWPAYLPSIAAAILPFIFLLRPTKLVWFGLLGYAVIICTTKSCSLALAVFVFSYRQLGTFPKYNVNLVVKCSLFICAPIVIYYFKEGSILGRLFIWYIIVTNAHNIPLFGFGFDSFKEYYAQWQAAYFLKNPVFSKWHVFADSPTFAFNELLHFSVEFGSIFASCYFIVFAANFYLHRNIKKPLYLSCIQSNIIILLVSLASYALHNYVILTLFLTNTVVATFHVLGIRWIKISWVTILTIIIVLYFSYFENKGREGWKELKYIPNNEYEVKNSGYSQLCIRLHTDQYFNKDLVEYLIKTKQSATALKYLVTNKKHFNQYEYYLFMADLFYEIGETNKAISCLFMAHFIIPNRFVPLAKILQIYLTNGDTFKAKTIASKILAMPIKIPNKLTDRIRQIAYSTINEK